MANHDDGIHWPLREPNILLFGSLALSFDRSAVNQVRKAVVERQGNLWLLDVISGLPHDCDLVTSALPALQPVDNLAKRQLSDLSESFRTGRPLEKEFPLPSTILIPLVVVAQLNQYDAFLQQSSFEQDDEVDVWTTSGRGGEALGLCTGLLSAFAVSSAHNRAEFQRFGSAAVRLGMIVGLVIDAQDAASGKGRSKSLTVAWTSSRDYEMMHQVVNEFKAYISVFYDENRATVTTSASCIVNLIHRLKAAGLSATELGLYGAFHSKANVAVLDRLLQFCDTNPAFVLPDASNSAMPTRSNDHSGKKLKEGALHAHALRSILVEPPRWGDTLNSALQESGGGGYIFSFGSERSIPASVTAKGNVRVVHVSDNAHSWTTAPERRSERLWADSDVAVVGMSCKVAGADSLEEFWQLLVAGESQHREIGKPGSSRFSFEDSPFRSTENAGMRRRWFANLIDGHDQFDHRFFKKSARESATMDPQQRHLLQAAYQAVEQSGYMTVPDTERDKKVGCYIGVCLGDYESNVACHPANAFTAIGNLQGFIAGKVSHFFGWTGPGLTIDTACSSSLVAVHQACQSILSGECNAALAGGTHIMTTATWFQNLAAGSFLSPTGQCKPFDAKGDGYCRGEGVGVVFLKKMSRAVADGDPILGVIAASAVQQNQNNTPIFVPNQASLADLFMTVTTKARVNPSQISVVEAHGTGTAVGDPAEYGSIRQVLGGDNRQPGKPLMVSSVKGLVGHIECTSGIISLVKILLMLNKGMLPPQASFDTINPALESSSADNMFIPTHAQPWNSEFRIALINNYGASGSNASLIVTQAPAPAHSEKQHKIQPRLDSKCPFWLAGFDDESLHRYAKALRKYLGRITADVSLGIVSFNLARQSNRSLNRSLIFTARSLEELDQNLAAFESGESGPELRDARAPGSKPPVVLCFGGQVSTSIGLDRQLYDSVAILRKNLNDVDSVVQSLGHASIFPGIFQKTPIPDTAQLQTMLFAMQYACACSWIDSGITPAALVGHSFGELTALCVSRTLSLEDSVKLVINRATLVRDAWGADRGAMLAIEANQSVVERMLIEANSTHSDNPASIACYNGPSSFVLAGSTIAIDSLVSVLEGFSDPPVKSKRLNVTNAFHSALVDPLLNRLEEDASGLTFHKPLIHLERTTENESTTPLTAKYVAEHMRNPVYFHNALKRLSHRISSSSCIFLEAGSNSTIASMASRALSGTNRRATALSFQGVSITNCDDAWSRLSETTLSLWKAGLDVQHWAHHRLQRRLHGSMEPLLLPPYQFDPNSRNWFEIKKVPKQLSEAHPPKDISGDDGKEKKPQGVLMFAGFQDGAAEKVAMFRINAENEKYKKLLSGHLTAKTAPICPATVQIGFVIDAICSISPESCAHREPQIQEVEYQSPVCANSARITLIEVTATDNSHLSYKFEVFSTENHAPSFEPQTRIPHTTGKISFAEAGDVSLGRVLVRFERLFEHHRALELLQSADVDEALANRSIYRIFSDIVDYGDEFRGLQKLVGRGNETAGHVIRKRKPQGENRDVPTFDPHLADTFCQLGGLWINCMTDCSPDDLYLPNGIDQWYRAPPTCARTDVLGKKGPDEFHVFAKHHRPSDRLSLTDVFVFDAANGSLVEVILGIAYVRVPKRSMERLLIRLSEPKWLAKVATEVLAAPEKKLAPRSARQLESAGAILPEARSTSPEPQLSLKTEVRLSKPGQQLAQNDVLLRVKAVIAELSGLKLSEINDDSELADLGIDSLAGMEMVHEMESTFGVTLPESEILSVTDMPGLVKCVAGAVGVGANTPSVVSSESLATTNLTTPAADSDVDKDERCIPALLDELELSFTPVMEAFNETKSLTDSRVAEFDQTHYVSNSLPLQNALTVALTIEAFESLGAGFGSARPGDRLTWIPHGKEHTPFVTYLYNMLETETQTIKIDGTIITRTAVPLPVRHSEELYEEMLARFPDQHPADKLTYYAGSNLARVLSGATEGVKLIFGNPVGRELVAAFYAEWPLNRVLYAQMEDFLTRLGGSLKSAIGGGRSATLRVLEMGAGTGGTTKRLVPLLAKLGVQVEYTFTDLAPSFVAAARKTWGQEYPFMKFRTHDIRKAPDASLLGTQHLVLASNAVHATPSLVESTGNARKFLRRDGFLLMLEMTRTPYWVDLIFGLFEGWWLFEDGRRHALTHESRWARDLKAAGYGHVDWTDGQRPETSIEKLILAAATGDDNLRSEFPATSTPSDNEIRKAPSADCAARERLVATYVQNLTKGFAEPLASGSFRSADVPLGHNCVLITGATGSLGAHLAAGAALRSDVSQVISLNRHSRQDPQKRQEQSFHRKGIDLPPKILSKITVFETDLSQPNLGLPHDTYHSLLGRVTHIVHNAWLMHSKWPVKRFEPQLQIMANMISLAREVSLHTSKVVTFQFVSSIATVGHHPLWTGKPVVPEIRMSIESVLPTGYGDAKYICERMLDATLHQYPSRFRAAAVRLGQIAGSNTNGHWSPMEHVPFLIKSSLTLKALPDLPGTMGWTPADAVADTLLDIVMQPPGVSLQPVYHIENPVRQDWKSTILILADALDIPVGEAGLIPMADWVRRVREWPLPEDNRPAGANPAFLLADFLDDNFVRMSCGHLLLGTSNARKHSPTLAKLGPVSETMMRLYVCYWKGVGFLNA